MFKGFALAVERFEVAAKAQEPDDAYIPLFEALGWAVALDSRTKEQWVPDGPDQKPGWGWRERVNGAEVLRGVRWARNAIHHDWADALRLDERGRRYPKTYPNVYFEWVWRPTDELPASERSDVDGEAVYHECLEGQPARVTLTQLTEAFGLLSQLLEPHALRPAPTAGGL